MAETLGSIFGNDEHDLAAAPGSASRVLSAAPAASAGPSLEDNLRSVQDEDTITQMGEVRAAQAQSLDQHAQYRAGLERAQEHVDLRAADLGIAEKAMGVFDTANSSPARRQFVFKQLVRQLGADPKSETVKDLWQLVRGLSPDESMAVRSNIGSQLSSAGPGQIAGAFRSVIRGELDPLELFSATRAQPQDAGRFAASGVAPQGDMALRGSIRDAITSRESSNVENAPPLSEAPLAGPVVPERPVPPDNRPVDPGLAQALGYDPNTSSSAEILQKHPGIGGLMVEDQQKLVKDLAKDRSNTLDTIKLINKALRIVEEEPRAVVFAINFGKIDVAEFNTAKYITMADDAIKTFARTLLPKNITEHIESNFPGLSDETKGDTIRAIASRNAELVNTVISLAYASAKAKDPSGRLSDQDIAIELRNLGWGSGSPDLLRASLQSHGATTVDRYNIRVRSETGGAPADIMSGGLVTLNSGRTQQTIPGTYPQAAPEQSTPAPGQTPPEQRTEALTPSQQAQQSRARAQSDEDVQQAQRRWNLEQAPVQARLQLEAAQRDVERLELAKQQAREQREYREYQKLQQQQRDAERRRDKIQAAFAQFARAMGSAVRGSVGGGGTNMGPDQDASAFKLAPSAASRRAPPTPGQARSGYDYVRRMKAAGG